MRCGIVTVYNSENCGSFLQAYAMSRALKKNGAEPVIVRQGFTGHSSTLPVYLTKAVKSLLRGRLVSVKRLTQRRKAFKQACENTFVIVDPKEALDCYILGSDVIWDLTEPYFKDNYTFFWGMQFENAKVISYAPSVGFAKEKDLENASFVWAALKKMDSVSVRDITSKQVLRPYCDKEIHLVCDPTYLIDRADYDAIAKPTDLEEFMFLYCYDELPAADREAIQSIAKEEGLKTVTFGNFNAWCDICLPYDPLLFLSIYDKAEYIITNTFHGTVFSTIYEKRFAVVNNDKQKILNVLKMCGLSHKMTKTAEDYATILHSDFDYATTRQNIIRERTNSLRYLCEALEERNTNG